MTADKEQKIAEGDAEFFTKAVKRLDTNYKNVQNTDDAALDSALLLDLAGSTLKLAKRGGDSAAGVDVDEFVTKCITFMNYGGPPGDDEARGASSAQQRSGHQRRHGHGQEEGEEDEDGEALDWELFGRLAAFPCNKRPAVPSFLLGPLSRQKRVRAPTQRTQRSARNAAHEAAARPQALRAEDLQQSDNASLTAMVRKVNSRLDQVIEKGEQAVDALLSQDQDSPDPPEEVLVQAMKENHVRRGAEEGIAGAAFWEFVINPRSFNQTVENIFYYSFLVRDGHVAVEPDEDGLPMTCKSFTHATSHSISSDTSCPDRAKKHDPEEDGPAPKQVKRQEILSFDMGQWQEMVKLMELQESLIPDREEDVDVISGTAKWY
jgi:non-structural maintenance of chromosomes element 4